MRRPTLYAISLTAMLAGSARAQFAERILTAPGFGADAGFGGDIALRDGKAVVTANGAVGFEGRARVYEWNPSTSDWDLVQTLSRSSPSTGDGFGASCAFHSDIIPIGAPSDSAGGFGLAGSVTVFEPSSSSGLFTSFGTIRASDSEAHARFGAAVACRGDWILVGAPDKPYVTGLDARGAVYAFKRRAGALHWFPTEDLKIRPTSGLTGERFGASLDMSANQAIIGVPRGGSLAGSTGTAFVYEESGGTWSEVDELRPGEDAGGFGTSVAIWGSYAVVGAPQDDSDTASWNQSGAAYVFERSGSTWTRVAKLVAPEEGHNLQFGIDVAIDDRRIVVGTLGVLDQRAYVFSRRDLGAGPEWFLSGTLRASDGALGDDYARVVAMEGDDIAIGAQLADPSASLVDGGKAYLLRYPSDFAGFCFADRGDCPCQDDPDAGCVNSTGEGALLRATGSGSLTARDLSLRVSGLPAGTPLIGVAGTTTSRVPLHDGLLCVGGALVRMDVRSANSQGNAVYGPNAALGIPGLAAGDVVYYQIWYRDGSPSGCGNGSNLSNGVRVLIGS